MPKTCLNCKKNAKCSRCATISQRRNRRKHLKEQYKINCLYWDTCRTKQKAKEICNLNTEINTITSQLNHIHLKSTQFDDQRKYKLPVLVQLIQMEVMSRNSSPSVFIPFVHRYKNICECKSDIRSNNLPCCDCVMELIQALDYPNLTNNERGIIQQYIEFENASKEYGMEIGSYKKELINTRLQSTILLTDLQLEENKIKNKKQSRRYAEITKVTLAFCIEQDSGRLNLPDAIVNTIIGYF